MKPAFKTILFVIFAHGFLLAGVPFILLRSVVFSSTLDVLKAVAFLPLALGGILYFGSVFDFAVTGKGTPAVWDPPISFVSGNLYNKTRNPMYGGMTLILIGEAVFFKSLWLFLYAIILWVFFHGFVMIYEEPALKKKFGKPYEHYLTSVPRWIPKFKETKWF